MSPVYRLVKVFPAHSHPSKIVEYACFSTAVSRLAHERQRLLEGHLTSREFLLVDLKRATSVQYISQELGMRRSGKLFGFGEILLGFGELLSLSVSDPFHHCFTHRDICGNKRGGKRLSQDREGLLGIRLGKEYLRFKYF